VLACESVRAHLFSEGKLDEYTVAARISR
jgi:hypothetical protein